MRIFAADGPLSFSRLSEAQTIEAGYPGLPGSTAYSSNFPAGMFSYQELAFPHIQLIKSSFQPKKDVTLNIEFTRPYTGLRIMLRHHAIHRLNEQRFFLMQGQYVYLSAQSPQIELTLLANNNYEIFDILFDTDYLSTFPNNVHHAVLKQDIQNAVRTYSSRPAFLNYLAHHALEELQKSPFILDHAESLLQYIKLNSKSTGTYRPVTENQIENLVAIKKLIKSQVTEDVHLDHWARQSGMNITYFKELFKYVFGITPYHYLMYERILAAKQFMQQHPQATLTQVAVSCGFSDDNNLRRAFQSVEKVTLSQWKKITGLAGIWLFLVSGDMMM